MSYKIELDDIIPEQDSLVYLFLNHMKLLISCIATRA